MQDINLIKNPIETPIIADGFLYLLWVFFIVVLIFFIFIFLFYYRKKYLANKNKIKQDEKIEKIDFVEIARNKLELVEKYLDNNELKKFHLELSQIIKEYLFYKYNEVFLDMTTREILSSNKLFKKEKEQLKIFFDFSDMAKYANKLSEKDAHREPLKLARKICT